MTKKRIQLDVNAKVGDTLREMARANSRKATFEELMCLSPSSRRYREKEGFPITALREIQILKELAHQNIVALHEVSNSKI